MSGAGIYVKTPSGLVAAATVPGPSGSQGPQSSLVPGTITTGAAGTNAAATITGAGPVQTLNLTIPKGDPGGFVSSSFLTAGTDLNALATAGLYYIAANVANTTVLGYPVAGWGGHIEVARVDSTTLVQRLVSGSLTYATASDYGAHVRVKFGNVWSAWRRQTLQGDIGSGDLTGTGFPNGAVTAPVGTYYTDTAVTNGARRWRKMSGSGNTGWIVVEGDTGWRNITADLINGWTASAFYVRRVDNTVSLAAHILNASAKTSASVWNPPVGYWPHYVGSVIRYPISGFYVASADSVAPFYAVRGGALYGNQASPDIRGIATYDVSPSGGDPSEAGTWPATLPGVAA